MKAVRFAAMSIVLALVASTALAAKAPWGADYFPNVPLITQDGEEVRFFDDLIENKIVAVNFIYTTCVDTCPLETAQLVRTARILGDRLGKDVHFYSITIDPERDTPEVLKEYRERFRANWTFLTGTDENITLIRRKLGLYIEEIQDGSLNHNVNMIIGNQATGRWMKRSPFENPYVLADQLGNWLSGWTAPAEGDDYANAPKLRSIPRGEQLFRTRCATCHTVTGDEIENALGPDLLGVTQQRELNWLLNWLRAPDQMLEAGDPIATALYKKYNNLAMPNMRLNKEEALDLIEYLDEETRRAMARARHTDHGDHAGHDHHDHGHASEEPAELAAQVQEGEIIDVANAWVRQADAKAKANAGYMTLINDAAKDVKLVAVESSAFETVEMHEMAIVDGFMKMREIENLVIPANGKTMFKPGGWHLMMKGPKQTLVSGQKIDMTLTFDSGDTQTVTVAVAGS
ncbi:MAG: copper chaperone PCu(A)C [Gammaproteobacteria bacterium]|nr:copper chaperone PCu(A)C [Gammaproteobacteria bacterium]